MASSSRAPPPSQPEGTYNVYQSHPLAAAAYEASELHLHAAALYVTTLLDTHGIPNALMGGFSMYLRGSTRVTHDIDVAVGCDMQTLLQALSTDKRVVRPLGPVSGVMRVFVGVGGEHEPSISSLHVSVDLILQGSLGAPLDPSASSDLISHVSPITNTATQYRIINVPAIMSAKLNAFFGRASQNDYQDIIFLLTKYPQEIYDCRAQLNQEHRQAFVEQYLARGAGQGKLKAAKHILGIV
ncbi:hypothetical protein ONS95_012691 [Cadophora gregata]|uniref:uncharacterized protein n=1 Tax=Cadophora gregata TaxID=51156 RepID=UPI0026DD5DA2|nr:uncharacterized protein ONS95_012691 [Cadophora gregata]KAK0118402.1 hypothetical protein ONS95_012691 [Cadophora gregata]KAK0123472.1 hypothetical protein ONS96_010455 [Cadophora gregata f. sp. sojae]